MPDPAISARPTAEDGRGDGAAEEATNGGRGYLCAELMRRTFGFDVLTCPRCGGRLRLVALIGEAAVIARILPPPRPVPGRPRALWAAPSRAATPAWSSRHPMGGRWTGVHASELSAAYGRVAPEVPAAGGSDAASRACLPFFARWRIPIRGTIVRAACLIRAVGLSG